MTDMKSSAYRSMRLAKLNKNKTEGGLKKWVDEEWLNLNALYIKGIELPCGTKYKGQTTPTVCRPKIDKSTSTHTTPKPLAYNLTKPKVMKAIEIKKKGERIIWKNL